MYWDLKSATQVAFVKVQLQALLTVTFAVTNEAKRLNISANIS